MKAFKYSTISNPGSIYNEDIAYASGCFGWVIDGATGLGKKNLTGAESDAKWFAEEWHKYLLSAIPDWKLDLKALVAEGIGQIEEKFFLKTNISIREVDKLEIPSAAIAIVRFWDDRLEYFALGDCSILIMDDGLTEIIGDERLIELDRKALCHMSGFISEGSTFEEARVKVNDMLIEHRLLKNTEQGYWTLEFDKKAVDNAQYGEIQVREGARLLLMSDGFSAISDAYRHVGDSELIELVEKEGLEHVYDIIRDIENKDAGCMKFPRFKKSDDASAVFFY